MKRQKNFIVLFAQRFLVFDSWKEKNLNGILDYGFFLSLASPQETTCLGSWKNKKQKRNNRNKKEKTTSAVCYFSTFKVSMASTKQVLFLSLSLSISLFLCFLWERKREVWMRRKPPLILNGKKKRKKEPIPTANSDVHFLSTFVFFSKTP